MMNPTLLILAAGLGSRYGGVKQMDKVGPSGESIIDYSIYDAIKSGFKKVVFVLNNRIIDDFRSIYEPRLKNHIETEYILQEISDIPDGIAHHPDREKPWGTGHAVLAARNYIHEPFTVINADDFYGRQAYELVSGFLTELNNQETSYAMVGYRLSNTLSDHGSVSRGICQIEKGYLTDVVERTKILRKNGQIVFDDQGRDIPLPPESVVSMNFWGFTPEFFRQAETEFRQFLVENAEKTNAEFYIPYVMNKLIKSGEGFCKVLTSNDKWFGVTYQEDKPITIEKINQLIQQGNYPENLWK
jgi:UTP-glucose-1-phosphate uridylyltransferase